ncbi:MAG: ABC transporter ATP-binding protein/permease [Clostridia bacterium]
MLKLSNIVKDYPTNNNVVHALKNVSLEFRENEFVGILGPSGCGKTTLLNILGGLDRYTSGDITIGNVSTKQFSNTHWDAYRNSSIGFVFQSYNLIQHLTVRENVELALTLSGENKKERLLKVIKALDRVDMSAEIEKKPNQLSGGQMQRVAIARALVNDPKIILADEPTGALDSELSYQVCDLLKEISKERLVIMVTHDDKLAENYCSRFIKFCDGEVVSDSNPYNSEIDKNEEIIDKKLKKREKKKLWEAIDQKSKEIISNLGINKLIKRKKQKKVNGNARTSMNFGTALSLSGRNLQTKKGRTFLTSFAASIGIIGLSLVLAISYGFNIYMDMMESTFLSAAPVGVYEYNVDYEVMTDVMLRYSMESEKGSFPEDGDINIVASSDNVMTMGNIMDILMKALSKNDISEDYDNYIRQMNPEWCNAINYYYGTDMHIINYGIEESGNYGYREVVDKAASPGAIELVTTVLGDHGMEPMHWHQLVGDEDFMLKYYDVMEGHYPQNKNELVLVVNEDNEVSKDALKNFGIDIYERNEDGTIRINDKGNKFLRSDLSFKEIIGTKYKFVNNNDYYKQNDPESLTSFKANNDNLEALYQNENNLDLEIVGILRNKPNSTATFEGNNVCYTSDLGIYARDNAHNSQIAKAQQELIDNGIAKTVFNNTMPEDHYLAENIIEFAVTNKLNSSSFLKGLGVDVVPYFINIYPSSNSNKDKVKNYIKKWNNNLPEGAGEVNYFDFSEMVNHNMNTAMDMATALLVAIASISLVVSSIMISVITTNSVIERTREIGILRSLGARAKDIVTVFVAENFLIGLVSGIFGVGIAYALLPLGNFIISSRFGVPSLLHLNPIHAIILIAISLFINVVSGLIPAFRASKKNVVDCLRVE